MESALLELKNVCKKFSVNGINNTVLDNINISIDSREFVAILGYTGCGKSTLLRIICGLDSPDSGEILFLGKNHNSPRKDIILLFQDLNQLFPWKTAYSNLVYVMKKTHKNVDRIKIKSQILELLKSVGLEGYENYYPHQMSGGMRQRCAVARAISLSPQILLMDEPFSALDELTRRRLQDLCRKIYEEHQMTVIFVTHSIEEAITLSDRIIILGNKEGSIVADVCNTYRKNKTEDGRIEMRNKIIKYLNKGERR